MTATAPQILVSAAHQIAGWTQIWTRLLAEHVTDGTGRCRACPSAMSVAPIWPCRIALLAAMAQAEHDRRAQ